MLKREKEMLLPAWDGERKVLMAAGSEIRVSKAWAGGKGSRKEERKTTQRWKKKKKISSSSIINGKESFWSFPLVGISLPNVFCPAPDSHPCKRTATGACIFPYFCTWSVCHSCGCCGLVSISKQPGMWRGGPAGTAPHRQRSHNVAPGWAVAARVLSPCWWGCWGRPGPVQCSRVKCKRARGDLLASSEGGQVELSLSPCSRHLCPRPAN